MPADEQRLFEPTLDAVPKMRPLYSLRANFMVAFFGGVFAAALFILLNSHRMGKMRKGVWIPTIAAAGWVAMLVWVGSPQFEQTAPEWMGLLGTSLQSSVRRLGSALGLLTLGGHFLQHRTEYKVRALTGHDSPNPWVPGLGSIAIAIIATGTILFWARKISDV